MQTENDYPISSSWIDINALSGIAIGQQMALHNAGRAGDIIEVAVSELEPISTFRGVAIKALSPMFLVSPQDLPLWVRYIRYDLTGTITPLPVRTCLLNVQSIADIQEIGGIPPSLLTTNDESMRIKTSSQDSGVEAAQEGRLYSITGQFSVLEGESLALNLSLSADSIIKSASTNIGLPIQLYDSYATGDPDGIFLAVNMSQLSIDESPSQGQLYEHAIEQGNLLASGVSNIDLVFITGYEKSSSILVRNTGLQQNIFINVILEEIGERAPVFGLTPSTFLQSNTEMSTYG